MAPPTEPMQTDGTTPSNGDKPSDSETMSKESAGTVVLTPEEVAWNTVFRKVGVLVWQTSAISQNVALLEKGAANKESRFLIRVLRTLTAQRRQLNRGLMAKVVSVHYAYDVGRRDELLALLNEVAGGSGSQAPSIEVDLYLSLLLTLFLADQKLIKEAIVISNQSLERGLEANNRSLDRLLARFYFYAARLFELDSRYEEIRLPFLNALRTATLRHDNECQITLLNELLRNLLHFNLYEQAEKLAAKTTLPESVGNNQHARYLYYTGRIKAIQLDYSEAFANLQQAIRKAPQSPAAPGFQQAAHKLMVIVQLLLGDIPERSLFRQPVLRKPLAPYLRLTQSVRVGDVRQFQEVMTTYGKQFIADKTYTLILRCQGAVVSIETKKGLPSKLREEKGHLFAQYPLRLHHNVIKTGVRMISLSYARISLRDLAKKLHLDSVEDAEYIVAKTIRDGVIEASLDHEKGYMQSKESADIYASKEPQMAFHQRIEFCLNLHNDAVKQQRKQFESVEDRRERELQEMAEIAEGADDDDLL